MSWDPKTRKAVKKYLHHRQARYIVRSTFGGLNDSFVASGSEDSLVYIWQRERGDLIAALPGHAGTVNAVHWNPARPGMLASVSDDQTVRLWEPSLPQHPPLPPLSPRDENGVGDDVYAPRSSARDTDGDGDGGGGGGGGGGGARGGVSRRGGGSAGRGGRGGGDAKDGAEFGSGAAGRGGGDGGGGSGVGGSISSSSSSNRRHASIFGRGRGERKNGRNSIKKHAFDGVGGGAAGEERGRGEWAYGLTPGQLWDGGADEDGYYDGGVSARIAALRW
ncbi:unnamed protein product [Laminaria digitata]